VSKFDHRKIFFAETLSHVSSTSFPLFLNATDEQYRASMSAEEWETRIGQYHSGNLWDRKDIFPMRAYLKSCITSSFSLGGKVWLESMLDSKIADGRTVREYVRTYPERFDDNRDVLYQ
jgi:hypothetical protein